jgi:hypothetical protein
MKNLFDPITEAVAGQRSLHNKTRRALIEQGVDRLNPVWFRRWEASHRQDVATFEADARRKAVAK